MKKIMFLIHDLGQGGAEKVLVNLVNNLDSKRFDVTLISLFGGGVNEQFLKPHVKLITVFPKLFPGNSTIMKIFSPQFLHQQFVKDVYDIEIAYLEGPSTRIVSGCNNKDTKKITWMHSTKSTLENLGKSFRNKNETIDAYNKFDKIICVSNDIKDRLNSMNHIKTVIDVIYNTNESDKLINLSKESVDSFDSQQTNLIAVGTLKEVKGFERLINIHSKLILNGYNIHTYVLGKGPQKKYLEKIIHENNIQNSFTLLGYDTNPYKYVAKSDLFVCSSYSEGFSTAATEALIVGTPVCTVDVSGMKEMLGENNEYGVVVENKEEALYDGIKQFLDSPLLLTHYKKMAIERGKTFRTENTVKAVENMLLSL